MNWGSSVVTDLKWALDGSLVSGFPLTNFEQ
jgi:hypothetical protein